MSLLREANAALEQAIADRKLRRTKINDRDSAACSSSYNEQ